MHTCSSRSVCERDSMRTRIGRCLPTKHDAEDDAKRALELPFGKIVPTSMAAERCWRQGNLHGCGPGHRMLRRRWLGPRRITARQQLPHLLSQLPALPLDSADSGAAPPPGATSPSLSEASFLSWRPSLAHDRSLASCRRRRLGRTRQGTWKHAKPIHKEHASVARNMTKLAVSDVQSPGREQVHGRRQQD